MASTISPAVSFCSRNVWTAPVSAAIDTPIRPREQDLVASRVETAARNEPLLRRLLVERHRAVAAEHLAHALNSPRSSLTKSVRVNAMKIAQVSTLLVNASSVTPRV